MNSLKCLSLTVITVTLLSLSSENAMGQSCLTLSWHGASWNPDSIMTDTCQPGGLYAHGYCRRHYTLRFEWYVLANVDTNYDTTTYQWTDIDTSYGALRASFAHLDSLVGPFIMQRRLHDISDTASPLSHSFILRFDSLLNVDTAISLLQQVPHMTAIFNGMPQRMYSAEGLIPGLKFSSITLDGSNLWNPGLHPLGWQWSIYKLKCPMAWEITQGSPSINIIGFDEFPSFGSVSTNPDVVPNFIQNAPLPFRRG